MKKIIWLQIVFLVLAFFHHQNAMAQAPRDSLSFFKSQIFDKQSGTLSLGARSTINLFFLDPKEPGLGAGGSFRLQFGERINTEWFADMSTSNIHDKANRKDAHIGWNVMFYLLNTKGFTRKFTPFLAAGHCFDYTGIKINGENQKRVQKWTSAVQMSLGCHYNITPKFDITLSSLYDLHLGRELEAEEGKDGGIYIAEHRNAGWEGHIMFILSAHYKICRLWKGKRI